jgi:hypothetical protein
MMGHLESLSNLTNILIFRFTKCEYCHAAASEKTRVELEQENDA